MNIDFPKIASRCGSRHAAFEELCCQIARRVTPPGATFVRLRGDGGDGGIECYADLADGTRMGWQAKYVDKVDSLLKQLDESLTTALKIHPSIVKYFVCFPFDLTGPTARRGKSQREKFDEWRTNRQKAALTSGRALSIVEWSASILRGELLRIDRSGGIREYFFNEPVLTPDWFEQHVANAVRTAGPRYSPALSVETELWQWFNSFHGSKVHSDQLAGLIQACQRHCTKLSEAVEFQATGRTLSEEWPCELRGESRSAIQIVVNALQRCSALARTDDRDVLADAMAETQDATSALRRIEELLSQNLETRHGKGVANSPGFRQYMAAHQCSFPASNVDTARHLVSALEQLTDWLESPVGRLGFERVCVITGIAGSGKTHGVCDFVVKCHNQGRLSCITFGHEFGGQPDPWARLRETLGLPPTIGPEALLDMFEAAAEASGGPLVLFLDGINETIPRSYWRERLASFAGAIERRSLLRLCVTCRTSFAPYCLPELNDWYIVEHQGFRAIASQACLAFCEYYKLEPPVTPLLQPELANPLYLKMVCETTKATGAKRLPLGWTSLAPAIASFLKMKEAQLASELGTSVGANIVAGSLEAVAEEIARTGETSLKWSKAERVIAGARPVAVHHRVLQWLVRADLLIEEAPAVIVGLGAEHLVRLAFERLGDFLIASKLLASINHKNLPQAFHEGGVLYRLFSSPDAVSQNVGLIGAMSIVLPEQMSFGIELPDLINDNMVRQHVALIAIRAVPWRNPASFTPSTIDLLIEGVHTEQISFDAMDAILGVACQPSVIDAFWLDSWLRELPMAQRDSFWCSYLHVRYENDGTVRHLIDATFDASLDERDLDVAKRWIVVLLWFTAAADRRVKDRATRAMVTILCKLPRISEPLLDCALSIDDDAVRERALLSVYGALLITRAADILGRVISRLSADSSRCLSYFDNALIRDLVRCFTEFGAHLNALQCKGDFDEIEGPISGEWPLVVPEEHECQQWERLPRLAYSCLRDDFFTYSLSCLRPWSEAVPKHEMGKWVLRHVAVEIGYDGSGAEGYDEYMQGKYGQGRGKPVWAERVGKKYQWIAMFRLASRLSDHAKRRRGAGEIGSSGGSLILLEERQLDPTLPANVCEAEQSTDGWWTRSVADFCRYRDLSDDAWVRREDDLPTIEGLVGPFEHGGSRWCVIESDPSWRDRPEDTADHRAYRAVLCDVSSYLVGRRRANAVFNNLAGRNLCGSGFPQSEIHIFGFLGEYPWAMPFWDSDAGGSNEGGLPCRVVPASEYIACEWQYDASIPRHMHIPVPAKSLFTVGELTWNGIDGFRTDEGRTVFRVPSLTIPGYRALIADYGDLCDRLGRMKQEMVITFIGEKMLLGGQLNKQSPYRCFSQVARIRANGKITYGQRKFFESPCL